MIELLQEYWRPFLYSDGQHITGLAMTMWLLSASLVIGFLVSIPLSIAGCRAIPWCAGRCSSTPTCFAVRRSISSC